MCSLGALAWLLMGAITLLTLTGCKTTKYVPMERVRVEYVEADTSAIYNRLLSHFEAQREKERKSDSLVDRMKETVILRENGDTARYDRERIVYRATIREKELEEKLADRDSIIRDQNRKLSMVKVDSVPVPYPVEKVLTAWQQTKISYGGYALTLAALALMLGLPIAVRWLIRRFKR